MVQSLANCKRKVGVEQLAKTLNPQNGCDDGDDDATSDDDGHADADDADDDDDPR